MNRTGLIGSAIARDANHHQRAGVKAKMADPENQPNLPARRVSKNSVWLVGLGLLTIGALIAVAVMTEYTKASMY